MKIKRSELKTLIEEVINEFDRGPKKGRGGRKPGVAKEFVHNTQGGDKWIVKHSKVVSGGQVLRDLWFAYPVEVLDKFRKGKLSGDKLEKVKLTFKSHGQAAKHIEKLK